jgi:hypothetical protein
MNWLNALLMKRPPDLGVNSVERWRINRMMVEKMLVENRRQKK